MTGRVATIGLVVVLAVGAGGCSSMSNTAAGAGIGGALGTGAGLALGAATGNPRTGALAGGLLGAGAGAAVGSAADREERREIRQTSAEIAAAQQHAQQRMGMIDVVQMVQAGHSEQVIINQIRSTGSTFQLSASDLDYLKSCGVPDRVVIEMQNAKPVAVVPGPRRVVIHEPPPAVIYERPAPVYVVPAYRPRPYVGVTYVQGWCR